MFYLFIDVLTLLFLPFGTLFNWHLKLLHFLSHLKDNSCTVIKLTLYISLLILAFCQISLGSIVTLNFLTKLSLSITNIFLSECKLLFQVVLILNVLTFSEKSTRLKTLVFWCHCIQAMLIEILRHQLLSNDLFWRNKRHYRFLLLFDLDLCFFHF